jgi:hypothetical protein
VEGDLNDELRDYVEREAERQIAAGALPEQARRTAFASLEGMECVKEECRDTRGVQWAEATVSDLQFACRSPERFRTWLLTCFALAAMLLSTLGTVCDCLLRESVLG